MTYTVTFTLDPAYSGNNYNPGPFNIYAIPNAGGAAYLLNTTGTITKTQLINGISYQVTDSNTGYIQSVGDCNTSINWMLPYKTYRLTLEEKDIEGRSVHYTDSNNTQHVDTLFNFPNMVDNGNDTFTFTVCSITLPYNDLSGSLIGDAWIEIGAC